MHSLTVFAIFILLVNVACEFDAPDLYCNDIKSRGNCVNAITNILYFVLKNYDIRITTVKHYNYGFF